MSPLRFHPTNQLVGFALGFVGFMAFAVLSLAVVFFARNQGQEYDRQLDAKRLGWKAEADAAHGALPAISDKEVATLLAVAPKAMSGKTFVVPGTPTFDALSAPAGEETAPPAEPSSSPGNSSSAGE